MSMDYVEIEFDRPRKLRFGFRDLRDLENRLGGVPFERVLDNRRALHLGTLIQALAVGLRSDDPRVTPARVEEMVSTYLGTGKPMTAILEALSEALMLSGIVGRPGEAADGDGRPT